MSYMHPSSLSQPSIADMDSDQENDILRAASSEARPTSVPAKQLDSSPCEECTGMGFQEIMSIKMDLPQKYQYGLLVADVGQRFKKSPENGCPLCIQLFSHRLSPMDAAEAQIDDEIRAFSFVRWYDGIDTAKYGIPDSGLSLCVVPRSFGYGQPPERMARHFREHGHVFCYDAVTPNSAVIAPRETAQDFDAGVVLAWLGRCRNMHHQSCSNGPSRAVSGLKLIDCTTNSLVVAASGTQYVALSYVWGRVKTVSMEPKSSTIPVSQLSTSILDAMSVTAALGFRYLWVDQYCIDQDDPVSKQEQITHMDLIYHNATLTIVAAAGGDQSFGLPGVSKARISPGKIAIAGRYNIIQFPPDIHYTIRSSAWFQRAWTFQEGLLSRRSLVFTENQVYYECAGTTFQEAIEYGPGSTHGLDDGSGVFSPWRGKVLGSTDLETFATKDASFHQVQRLVEQFTARRLSFDADSLNAFLGVLRYFETNHDVYHIWGIPFVVHPTMVSHHPRHADAYLVDGLCWRHVHSCWGDKGPEPGADGGERRRPRRRAGFPSWSWAGWEGAIKHDREAHDHQMSLFGALWSSPWWLAHGDGEQSTFDEVFVKAGVRKGSSFPKALVAYAGVVNCDVVELQDDVWTVFGFPAGVNLSAGPASPSSFLAALRRGEYHCILVGIDNRLGLRPKANVFIMVVAGGEDNGDGVGVVQRCGIITVKVPHARSLDVFLNQCPTKMFRLE